MRRLLAFAAPLLLLAAAVPLAGCATTGTGAGPLAATEADEKAFAFTEASYELAAKTYIGLVERGEIARGSAKAIWIADLDRQIQDVLEPARLARKAGDAPNLVAFNARLTPLVVQLINAVAGLETAQ